MARWDQMTVARRQRAKQERKDDEEWLKITKSGQVYPAGWATKTRGQRALQWHTKGRWKVAEDDKRSKEKLEETRRTSSVKTLHQEETPPFRCSGVASSTAARRRRQAFARSGVQ